MVNICELLTSVVTQDKPKMLIGLNQNGKWSGIGIPNLPIVDVAPSA
jgi:hypothetical protein